ncbi:MAG: G8 domain-containing protein [Planctomycetota bacterium]
MATCRFERLSPRILLHGDDLHGESPTDSHHSTTTDTATQDPSGSADHATSGDGHSDPHHGDSNPHDDPVLAGEHAALLDLVPHDQVTHRAVASGPWSAIEIWQDGIVPDDLSHVLIPAGITVEVDQVVDARLSTIRVDGVLNFASDVDTGLAVDTFIVAVDGTLNIGTSAAPIAPDASVTILFTDDGPIDTSWDPKLLSRGLISHGAVEIFGAEKTAHVDVGESPEAGDTELVLESAVEGWEIGDRVLVPGVIRPLENNQGVTQYDEDEIVTISSISADGRTIGFDQPLQYDHVPPRAQLDVPVANLDRNINFKSENTTDPQRAGHIMFMHSPEATVNYASFDHIGRNDKSVETTDPDLDENGILIPATGLNARGRYAVHFHRMGSETTAATVTGSVVENNPGWGFVNHDSNVVFRDNVSYNVKGAGFVTEVGSERGAFISNLAVRSTGKNFYQPIGASDKGEGNGFGSAGHGFWLQSASVALINNVASGHAQEGIFVHSRSVTEFGRELPTYTSLIDTPLGTPLEFSGNATEPAIRDDLIRTDQAAMAEMSGNTVFGSGAGVAFRWRRQTAAVSEGTNGDVFENFQIWNVEWAGIHLGYASGLTLSDGLILGNIADPISLSNRELDDRSTEPSEFHTSQGKGIVANRNSKDLVFKNLEVAGFTVGIQALTQSHTRIDTVLLQNIENLLIVTPQASSQSDDARRIDATNVFNIPLPAEALDGATPYNVRLMKQLERAPVAGGSSAASEWAAFTADDEIYYNGNRLYFHDQAADAVPFASSDVPGFMNGGVYQQYVDLTNQELLDDFSLALGSAVAPAEAFDGTASLGIDGLVVPLDEPVQVPDRVEFGVDAELNPTTWTMNEVDLQIQWRSKALSEATNWRVYLSGENGTQEIGRTGLASDYASVSLLDPQAGWQVWQFEWPTVGLLPPQWQGSVDLGEHSLVAVADGSPAVYLGRVTIGAEASPMVVSAPESGITSFDGSNEAAEEIALDQSLASPTPATPNDIAIETEFDTRTGTGSTGRGEYRTEAESTPESLGLALEALDGDPLSVED